MMIPERVKRVRQAGPVQSGQASMSQRRTSGSVGSFFWRMQPQTIEEGIREEAEREVVMEPAPGATLEVIEPEFFFQLLITLFHFPALVRQHDQVGERRVGGEVG